MMVYAYLLSHSMQVLKYKSMQQDLQLCSYQHFTRALQYSMKELEVAVSLSDDS